MILVKIDWWIEFCLQRVFFELKRCFWAKTSFLCWNVIFDIKFRFYAGTPLFELKCYFCAKMPFLCSGAIFESKRRFWAVTSLLDQDANLILELKHHFGCMYVRPKAILHRIISTKLYHVISYLKSSLKRTLHKVLANESSSAVLYFKF